MPIEYYIGIAVGVISVVIAYVLLRLTKRDSMCDKCKYMTFKDWLDEPYKEPEHEL